MGCEMHEFKRSCFQAFLTDVINKRVPALVSGANTPLGTQTVVADIVKEIIENVEINFCDDEDTPLEKEYV